MCWIAFKRSNDFDKYFNYASKRGTDWLGVIKLSKGKPLIKRAFATSYSTLIQDNSNTTYQWFEDEEKTKKTIFPSYWELYQKILTWYTSSKSNKFFLMHHRKATSGNTSVSNVHPFETSKYIIIQNGSASEFEGWGAVEYPFEKGVSDTWFLSQYINWLDGFEAISAKLNTLDFNLGVIAIVDKSNNQIMMWSDAARSFYFCFDNAEETKLEYASSLTETGGDEYTFKWSVVFDFEGNIIKKDTEFLNKKKVVTIPILPAARNHRQDKVNTCYDFNASYFSQSPDYKWDIEMQKYILSKGYSNHEEELKEDFPPNGKYKKQNKLRHSPKDVFIVSLKSNIWKLGDALTLTQRENAIEILDDMAESFKSFELAKIVSEKDKFAKLAFNSFKELNEITFELDTELYSKFIPIWEHV